MAELTNSREEPKVNFLISSTDPTTDYEGNTGTMFQMKKGLCLSVAAGRMTHILNFLLAVDIKFKQRMSKVLMCQESGQSRGGAAFLVYLVNITNVPYRSLSSSMMSTSSYRHVMRT